MIMVAIYQFIERKLAARAAYRRALDELSMFTQRDLFDIHMSSADIPLVAAEAAHEAEEKLRLRHGTTMQKLRALAI
jgi:uncharacterized protein YjiS (DUF1127 family)